MKVNIVWFPEGAEGALKTENLLIVVDNFRCSSFVSTAMWLGAKVIHPTASVEEAFRLVRSLDAISAGEVNAIKVPGFDLGNSPTSLLSMVVKDKVIVLRTSAGTQVIDSIRKNRVHGIKVLIGCLLNAQAVAVLSEQLARDSSKNVTIICSGRGGTSFALEDYIAAGAIINHCSSDVELTDSALGSLMAFKGVLCDGILKILRETESAKRLFEIGAGSDFEYCCQLNKQNVVPMLFDQVIKNYSEEN